MKIKNKIKKALEKVQDSIVTLVIDAIVVAVAHQMLPFLSLADEIGEKMKFFILTELFLLIFVVLLIMKKAIHHYAFHITKEKAIMEYQRNNIVLYQKILCYTTLVKARKIHTRKTWFSNEKFKFQAQTEGFYIEPYKKIGYDNEYYVVFPRDFKFHEPIEFETKFWGENKNCRYENFYWVDIECPMDLLVLEVRLPRDCCTGKIKKKMFLKHEEARGSTVEVETFDGVYRWKIKDPKLNWSYVLEWEWSKAEKERIMKIRKMR